MSNDTIQNSHKPASAPRVWPKRWDSQTDRELPKNFNAVADEGLTAIGAAPSRILFVCTGNTCRSPMAEGLCTTIAQELGVEVQATSAGIGAGDGSIPSLHAVAVMREMGIEMALHRVVPPSSTTAGPHGSPGPRLSRSPRRGSGSR